MRTKVLIFLLAATALFAAAETTRVVIQSGKLANGHNHNEIPSAVYSSQNCELRVDYIANDSLLSVTLTDPSGEEQMVNGSSPSISVPITGQGDGFVVTVRTADGSTFDGVFSRSGAGTVTLSDHQALQLAKNRRLDMNEDGVLLYSTTAKSIINDAACPVASLPQATWTNDTTCSKWLIFADHPATLLSARECVYTYMPKTLSVSDTVPYVAFESHAQSPAMRLMPLNFTFGPEKQHRAPLANRDISQASCIRALIVHTTDGVGSDVESAHEYMKKWNECAQFYNILTQLYGVPKQNIKVVFLDISPYYDFGDYIPSRDFDGDGIDDYNCTLTVESALDSLAGSMCDQLLVYYANSVEVPLLSYPYEYTMGIPKDRIENVGAKYVHYLISTNHAQAMVHANEDFYTVFTSATTNYSADELHPCGLYYAFPFYWLSALAHQNILTGATIPLVTDLNDDGYDSYRELLVTASNLMQWDVDHEVEYVNYDLFYNPNPRYTFGGVLNAFPDSLTRYLGINHIPNTDALAIRQTGPDTPSGVVWDSPDIWVRGTDNGMTYQENACFKVDVESNAYIYVRLTNNDSVAYTGGKKLNLFWEPAYLGIPGYGTYDEDDNKIWHVNFPNHIESIAITDTILPGASVIKKYEWCVPFDVVQECEDFGRIMSVNIGAMVSDFNYSEMISNGVVKKGFRDLIIHKNNTVVNIEALPLLTNSGSPLSSIRPRRGLFPIKAYNQEEYGIYDLFMSTDSAKTTGSIFSYNHDKVYLGIPCTIGVEGLHGLVSSGNYLYQLAAANAWAEDWEFNYSDCKIMTMEFTSTGAAGLNDIDHQFNLYLKNGIGDILGGQTLRIYHQGNGGTGGGIMPGIQSNPGSNRNYTLTATGVADSARFEWLDAGFNKVDEGRTVIVNRDEIGDVCVLRVTRAEDGTEAYAITTLDGVPAMESVSPVPMGSEVSVCLTDVAVQGMSVRIIPVMGTTSTVENVFPAGDRELIISTASLPSGPYVVCLVHNGSIVQSVNVVK